MTDGSAPNTMLGIDLPDTLLDYGVCIRRMAVFNCEAAWSSRELFASARWSWY